VLGLYPDTSGPQLVAITLLANNQLQLQFSEAIDSLLAADVNNYSVDPGIGTPVAAFPLAAELTAVQLVLPDPLDSFTIYNITVTGIEDCSGNLIAVNTLAFGLPHPAERYDVVFNELLPDPEPSVGLPALEFVELYKRSNKVIDLGGWQLQDPGSTALFENFLLMPGAFAIVCSSGDGEAFSGYGDVIELSSFPSLNNTGDSLWLYDNNSRLVDFVFYNDNWYNNDQKAEGGYTLEKINYHNYCLEEENWKASNSATGGTPGTINSVFSNVADVTAPQLLRATVPTANEVVLYFSETLDSVLASNPQHYTVDQGVGNPAMAQPVSPQFRQVILTFSNSLLPQTVYTVTVDQLTDCSGNTVGIHDETSFGIPQAADSFDLIINEVLFNPRSGGVDFVEVYNRSEKILSLGEIVVAEHHPSDPDSLLDSAPAFQRDYLLMPAAFAVLTSNALVVEQHYYVPEPLRLVNVPGFPNYPDDEGVVTLFDSSGNIIDRLHYYSDWHFPLLSDEDGVSLERIRYHEATQSEANWQSAASTAGFATPGYENSQSSPEYVPEDLVELIPQVFSPDGDGYNDVLTIAYTMPDEGWVANGFVFDSEGREIIHLVRNELLGTQGEFKWDGVNARTEKSAMGIYLFCMELFHPSGAVLKVKKPFVLAGRL
jgi:hypothetical protein